MGGIAAWSGARRTPSETLGFVIAVRSIVGSLLLAASCVRKSRHRCLWPNRSRVAIVVVVLADGGREER